MKQPLVRAFLLLSAVTGATLPTPACGHQFGALQIDVGRPHDSEIEIIVTVDPEHLPPGVVPPATPAAERGDVALLELVSGLAFESGGEKLPVKGLADLASVATASPSGGELLAASFTVVLPEGARGVRVREGLAVGAYVVRAFAVEGAEAPLHWAEGGGAPVEIAFGAAPAPLSRVGVVLQYLVLGFEHILPKGLDHICFVLGLFLLSTRWRALLAQVTAFTVAHTLTLAASIYGVVRLAPAIVEPLIALSIAYVAIENLVTSELKPWRPALVFAFGLLHGLGFAGVLTDLGLPRERFLTALLSFNAGVELGQLAVLAGAFLLVGYRFSGRPWYRRRVVLPASLAIAAVGLYWFVERAFFSV